MGPGARKDGGLRSRIVAEASDSHFGRTDQRSRRPTVTKMLKGFGLGPSPGE